MRSSLNEHVFVLAVANDQCALAGPVSDYKFEAHIRRVDGDERNRAIIVLPGGYLAFPSAEVERRRATVVYHCNFAEGGTRIAGGQFGNKIGTRLDDQALTFFRECGF